MDNTQKLAEQAAEALNRANEIKSSGGGLKVWMPNAIGVNPRPFLEARARMHKDQNEIFEHAERLVKDPEPGFHYGWAKLGAPITVMRAGSGQYKYIKPDQVKSDLRAMFTTHKGVTGELVCNGSNVLIGIPPKAWAECYIEPEIEAVARLATEQDNFQAQIESQSQGTAKATLEAAQERE